MRAARIGQVDVPEGGVVAVDADGVPTGLLEEQAQLLVRRLLQPHPLADLVADLTAASERYLAEGVTSCTEAGVGGILGASEPLEVAAYQHAVRNGGLRVRVTLMPSIDALHESAHHADDDEPLALDLGLHSGFGDDRLRIGPTKIFADGSLMGRTAAMFEPFEGEPGNTGYLQMDEGRLHSLILRAHRSGWQVATHAIGDRAVASVLDAYEEALRRHPRPDHRTGSSTAGSADRPTSPASPGSAWCPCPRRTSSVRSVTGCSAPSASGGAPTATARPASSPPGPSCRQLRPAGRAGRPPARIHDLVNQRTASGRPFNPQEALTAEQALHAYTVGSAHAAFDEQRKGSIEPAKLADLVVLDRDLTAVDPEAIGETRVLATMVGGTFAFDAAGLA
jgi:predicted amidohydrolase YtcJ